jgi:hypothetical protein
MSLQQRLQMLTNPTVKLFENLHDSQTKVIYILEQIVFYGHIKITNEQRNFIRIMQIFYYITISRWALSEV